MTEPQCGTLHPITRDSAKKIRCLVCGGKLDIQDTANLRVVCKGSVTCWKGPRASSEHECWTLAFMALGLNVEYEPAPELLAWLKNLNIRHIEDKLKHISILQIQREAIVYAIRYTQDMLEDTDD